MYRYAIKNQKSKWYHKWLYETKASRAGGVIKVVKISKGAEHADPVVANGDVIQMIKSTRVNQLMHCETMRQGMA